MPQRGDVLFSRTTWPRSPDLRTHQDAALVTWTFADLLAVDDVHPRLLQLEEHRRLGEVHADRHIRDAGLAKDLDQLLGHRTPVRRGDHSMTLRCPIGSASDVFQQMSFWAPGTRALCNGRLRPDPTRLYKGP